MNNQNIYSSEFNGYISINRTIISKLGLNDKPFLRAVYILLIERANWTNGIVLFSSRFAQESFKIGQKEHKKIINDLINLGLVKELNKGKTTVLEIIHYNQVTKGDKKELDKGTEPNETVLENKQIELEEKISEAVVKEVEIKEPVSIDEWLKPQIEKAEATKTPVTEPVRKPSLTFTKVENTVPLAVYSELKDINENLLNEYFVLNHKRKLFSDGEDKAMKDDTSQVAVRTKIHANEILTKRIIKLKEIESAI
jgi:hypothetical protein